MQSKNFLLSVLCCLFSVSGYGQEILGKLNLEDSTQIHRITTNRGDQFVGQITSIRDTEVSFMFDKRIPLQFQLSELKKIEVYYRTPMPVADPALAAQLPVERIPMQGHEELIFSATGFGFRKGEGEYRNIGLFYNSLQFGATDHLTLGGSITPLFAAALLNVKAKLHTPLTERMHVGLAYNAFIATEFIDNTAYGVHLVMPCLTFGTPEAFINLSGGYAFPFLESGEGSMVLSGSGSKRIGNKWRLMGEAIWIATDTPVMNIFGASWFNERHRVDFGLFGFILDGYPLGFPYATYALSW